jgi:hypothetical protein
MRLAKLTTIDEDILLSSTIAASTESEYDSGTTYATGDVVKVSYESDGTTPLAPVYKYESLADSNTGNYPPDNPTQWSEIGATNRWSMFDDYVNTQSEDTEEVEIELDSSNQNIVGLFRMQAQEVTFTQIVDKELLTDGDCSSDSFTAETGWSYDSTNDEYDCDGTQTSESRLYQGITVKSSVWYQVQFTVANYSAGNAAGYVGGANGTNVSANGDYTQIIAPGSSNQHVGVVADADFVGSITSVSVKKVPNYEVVDLEYYDVSVNAGWYYYFFTDVDYLEDAIWSFTDYNSSILRINVRWKSGENAKCGMVALGKQYSLGKSQYEPVLEILDYSKKETDSQGRTYLKQGNFAKRAEVQAWIYNSQIDAIRRALQSVVGQAVMFDGNNEGTSGTDYTSLVIYGFLRGQSITIPGPVVSRLDIDFEGLI